MYEKAGFEKVIDSQFENERLLHEIYEHLHPRLSRFGYEMLHRNRELLTEEVNAAARGAFAAGANTVVVHDHHGAGYTILPDRMKLMKLIQLNET